MSQSNQELMAKALSELRRLKSENAALKSELREPIAVVGMSCRFPGKSENPEAFWNLLESAESGITSVPDDRRSAFGRYADASEEAGSAGVHLAGFVDNPEAFDPLFFGISPKEARSLDPQQRLLLELAWECLEQAAISPTELAGKEVGVFVGLSGIDYALKLFQPGGETEIDPYFGTGATQSPAAGRLSYFLKVTGPSLVVDTACSSSLVALHLACESLRKGECEAALVGGVNRILSPQLSLNFARSGLLASDGQCFTFDTNAHGYARGEGGGMLLLKRQTDAEQAGDVIQALVLGSATNQDGGSGGLTVPSGPSQQRVVRRALERAGITPDAVDYVETHGTATPLGDPIEANALGEVFQDRGKKGKPLQLGSVKTNFGHLEAAAGMASLIKVILSLKKELLPPHRNFNQPSPHIDWDRYPLQVVTQMEAWPRGERRRIAGINGFGFAGTNAHIVLAEAPLSNVSPEENVDVGPDILVLSGKGQDALKANAARLMDYVEAHPQVPLGSIAATLRHGRFAFSDRLAMVAENVDETREKLRQFANKGKAKGVQHGLAKEDPAVAFVFTGQGAQYAGMAHRLYLQNEYFRSIIDECADKLVSLIGTDLRAVLFEEADSATPSHKGEGLFDQLRNADVPSKVDETRFTQPALFVVEYALARLWQSWGLQPSFVLGHSVGEYAAACVAGVFSLEDGLKMIAARGSLMEELSSPGAMLTVFGDEAVVAGLIQSESQSLAIAAVNGPGIILVSGSVDSIAEMEKRVDAAGLRSVRMRISHAFHSPLTKPVLPAFRKVLKSVTFQEPSIPLISNVTGQLADDSIASPEYWVKHLQQSVRFNESMSLLHRQQMDFLVEIGPEPTLIGLDLCFREVREQAKSQSKWVPSLRRGFDDIACLLDSLGLLWTGGFEIDWAKVFPGRSRGKVSDLPTYAFQRKRHWFDSVANLTLESLAIHSAEQPAAIPASVEEVVEIVPESALPFDAQSVYEDIVSVICEVSGLEAGDLRPETSLLEMGLDSLMFVRMGRVLEKRYTIDVPLRRFYDELHRLGALRDFILAEGKAPVMEKADAPQPAPVRGESKIEPVPVATENNDPLGRMIAQLLPMLEAYLGKQTLETPSPVATPKRVPKPLNPLNTDSRMTSNFGGMEREEHPGLSDAQKRFLKDLAKRYNGHTAQSKQLTRQWRKPLADWKGSLQFKKSLKDFKYPIVCERAAGARIWDVDGNEYIDFAMGMGVHFFGHKPSFINEAIHHQLERSSALGPQSDLAGIVAEKICRLTGCERASLAITGSGAVLLAQRIARAEHGKPLIAQFGGAYHGIGSEVLAIPGEEGPQPISPGIPSSVVQNALILDYGSEEALDQIRAHADQLAAVMVEPVQSRRPGFQPHRFLKRLRKLTAELDIALIFDEMINGFRIDPAGAQAWFGVKADIVTYGKVVGGGLPLAAIAGKARYLDHIDGGYWDFDDESVPGDRLIFTGGTHNRHPLALAAANASLDHMLEKGVSLHQRVNKRTDRMVRALNAFLEEASVAMRVASFGSQFRFEGLGDQSFEMEVFFYLLTLKGYYTWEQRICCVSTEHSESDLMGFVDAVREAVEEMRAAGFTFKAGQVAPRRVYPLSSVQRRLFALCQRDAAEFPYHLSGIWEIEGQVDAFKVEDAFHEIIRRHESLRTAFVLIGDEPKAWLLEEPRFFIEKIDGAGRSPDELIQSFIRPFELSEPPLLRVGLAEVDEGRHWLLIDVHHIAADGLSMNTILNEFARIYDGDVLKPVARQYRHAMLDLAAFEASDSFSKEEAYWRKQLEGEYPLLELPLDKVRPHVADFRGDRKLLRIPPAQTEALEKLARAQGVSLFMVLTSAFAVLLHRLSGANDLTIGLPVAGRPGTENDAVVGMFVNSLPLRFRPQAEIPFKDFLQQVRDVCLGAYEHQDYPYERMVAISGQRHVPGRNPLFDVMFAYENADDRLLQTRDLTIRSIDQFEGSGMFDFNIDVIREDGYLNVAFHYATSLFREDTIQVWMGAFERLLAAVVRQTDAPLAQLQIWDPESVQRVFKEFNQPPVEDPEEPTLVRAWEDASLQYGDAIALECEKRSLTYDSLDERSLALAESLCREGIGVGSKVALLLDSTEAMVIAIFGVLRAGAAYVPIDPQNPIDRVAFFVRDSEASLILTDRELSDELSVPAKQITAFPQEPGGEVELPRPKPQDLAYVIYTSGSTGTPKGVEIEHQAILHSINWRVDYYDFSSADITLQMPSYAFDASLLDIFPVLFSGGRLVLLPTSSKRDLNVLRETIRSHRITNLLLTPSLYGLFLEEMASDLKALRFVTLAGEATTLSLLQKHFEKLPKVRLFNEYGPTENSVVTTCGELFADSPEVTIGKPVAGHDVVVLEPNGAICPPGIRGELVVAGPGLARGYLGRQDLTDKAFVPAPWNPSIRIYRTGDYARWTEKGELLFEGRIDGQVKLHGYRIELGEIENALLANNGVKEATVRIVTLSTGDAQLAAYIVPKNGYDEKVLRQELSGRLPAYMVPTVMMKLTEIPRNRSGKVDTSALPLPSTTDGVTSEAGTPSGKREEVLAEVWQEVLQISSIGRHDDYFRLGGDSIKGIMLVSRLAKRGWQLDMQMIFEAPTIATQAPLLNRAVEGIEQEDGNTHYPLSMIQRWFFRKFAAHPDHFNLSVWLDLDGKVEQAHLEQGLKSVWSRHDVFALRFRKDARGDWFQTRMEEPVFPQFEQLAVKNDADLEAIEREHQATLSLGENRLSKAIMVKEGSRSRLLLVVHHLLVDGISWRILIDDLNHALKAILNGALPTWADTPIPFGGWVRVQEDALLNGAFSGDETYWKSVCQAGLPKLPDTGAGEASSSRQMTRLSVEMDGKFATQALSQANALMSCRGNELMLSALREAYGSWNPGQDLYLMLESHGRDPSISKRDYARTVGWFTSHYPVRFPAGNQSGYREWIQTTKANLRRIPHNGAGYLFLREIPDSPLSDLAEPEISFNFLGELKGGGDESLAILSARVPGFEGGPHQKPVFALNLFGWVNDGKLYWILEYDSVRFSQEKARSFLWAFQARLEAMILESLRMGRVAREACDFSLIQPTSAQYQRFLAKAGIKPELVEDLYPLTAMQEGLYFESGRDRASDAYFEQMSFSLEGKLDRSAFERAWQRLSERHPVLRSVFDHRELEQPVQVVLREQKVPVAFEDFSKLGKEDQIEALDAFYKSDREKGFDLQTGPLLRISLIRLGDSLHRVVWSHHHILMDGWCIGILYDELMAFYAAEKQFKEAKLPKVPDYMKYWDWLLAQNKGTSIDYWKGYLSNYDELASLPRMETPKPGDYKHAEVTTRISPDDWERLCALAAEARTTPATILQALWGTLLCRYNNRRDVVFGSIVSGRPESVPEIERMVGLFINATPVRFRLEESTSFMAALKQLQQELHARRPHEYVSLAEIQEQASQLRTCFDHLVVMENYPMDAAMRSGSMTDTSTGLHLRDVAGFERTHYDFNLVAVPNNGLEVQFTFNAAVYPRQLIEQLGDNLQTLIDSVLRNPEAPCAALSIVSERDMRMIETWNDTRTVFPREATVVSLFSEQVRLFGKRVAVSDGKVSLTYQELDKLSNQIANALIAEGISVGDSVVVWLDRDARMIAALLGIAKAGGVYVPLDPVYPADRLRFMVEDCGAKLALTHSKRPIPVPVQTSVDVNKLKQISAEEPLVRAVPRDPLYIIYTSGSTGQPKGCRISHRNVVRLMRNEQHDFDFNENDVWVVAHSFCFDFSVWEMYGALLNGGRVIVPSRDEIRDTRRFVDLVAREGVTVLNQTPAAFYTFAEEALRRKTDLSQHLRYVIFGGDKLEARYLEAWGRRYALGKVALINMYGITETTVHVSYHRVTEAEIAEGSGRSLIGRPLPETQVWILDEGMNPLPVGVAGELYVGGSGVCLGYLNRPELNEARFVPHPFEPDRKLYRTGDLGRLRPDGVLEYLGRNDHQVQVRGFRVETGEIELALLSLPGVEKSVVLPRVESNGQTGLAAWLVGKEVANSRIREHLSTRLPEYMIPGWFTWVDTIPLTANGKIDRKALPEPGKEATETVLVEPRTPAEREIAAAWCEVLQLDRVGVDQNFFEVGGQSLKAVRLAGLLEQRHGWQFSLRDLFACPTVAEQAALMAPESSAEATLDEDLEALMEGLSPEELQAQLDALED